MSCGWSEDRPQVGPWRTVVVVGRLSLPTWLIMFVVWLIVEGGIGDVEWSSDEGVIGYARIN